MRSGASGVLLAFPAPDITCTVPISDTVSNGSTKVISAVVAALFEIWRRSDENQSS
jgi:hypothetical protein